MRYAVERCSTIVTVMPHEAATAYLEIFMCFLPQDLLSLSRTSKAFHEILFRKSSACCWKPALRRIEGPPSVPEGAHRTGVGSFPVLEVELYGELHQALMFI